MQGGGPQGAYDAAKRNGWLDQICGHMVSRKPIGYWMNMEAVRNEALKYESMIIEKVVDEDVVVVVKKSRFLGRRMAQDTAVNGVLTRDFYETPEVVTFFVPYCLWESD